MTPTWTVPSYSANPVQTWMDYNRTTIERELAYAQDGGLNAVRVFLSLFAWKTDREVFLSNLDHLITSSAAHGIKPLLVVFDDDFFDVPSVNTSDKISAWVRTGEYKHLKWMANPGMGINVKPPFRHSIYIVGYIACMCIFTHYEKLLMKWTNRATRTINTQQRLRKQLVTMQILP